MRNSHFHPAVCVLSLLLGCSDDSKAGVDAVAAADLAAAIDTALDAVPDADGPPQLGTLAQRGLAVARNVVHIHSAYSHDACDNWISDHPGEVSPTCLQDLRTSLCESGLDVAFMTDHPGRMKDHTFTALLDIHLDQGDTPVGPVGAPYANVVHCPKSATLPAHDLVRTVGFEGTHNMAIGIHNHFKESDKEGTSFADADSKLEDAKASVAQIHLNKGLSCNAHSEEDDISVQRMVDVGLDAMEVYNTHANFKTIVGVSTRGAKMNLGRVFLLDKLLGDPAKSPDPDLALLIMLDIQPEAAFTKWQAVNAQRAVTAVIGNDVHQNVKLESYCGPGGQLEGLCDAFVDQYPSLVALLKKGGPVMTADGKRLDDYKRLLRWISNHTLVKAGTLAADLPEASKDAIKAGRNWAVFNILGDPAGVDFVGFDAKTSKWVEMGGQMSLGSKIHLRVPDVVPMPWAHWTAQDSHNPMDLPVVSLVMWRITPGVAKADKVATLSGTPGQVLPFTADQPGKYHLELRVIPKHLRKLLNGLKENTEGAPEMADLDQRWAVGNPIEIK